MSESVIQPFSAAWWAIVIVGGLILGLAGPIVLGLLLGLALGSATMFLVGRVVDLLFD